MAIGQVFKALFCVLVGLSMPLTASLLASSVLAPAAHAAEAQRYASIVVDLDTGEVLHARNADDARFPASITKVMTLYMLFDALEAGEIELTDTFVVSKEAASRPRSKLGVRAGSRITVRDAIAALVTKSANDVAVVVAEGLGGTEARFATLMTAKARKIGMRSTVFTNASGLPDANQVSTARDIAIMGEAIQRDHPDYYAYFAMTDMAWGKSVFKNHNNLLGNVEGVNGIKTGYTNASGFNLLAAAERDGHRVIVVVLGGSTSSERDGHVGALFEAAYAELDRRETERRPDLRIAFDAMPRTPVITRPIVTSPSLRGRIEEGSTAN